MGTGALWVGFSMSILPHFLTPAFSPLLPLIFSTRCPCHFLRTYLPPQNSVPAPSSVVQILPFWPQLDVSTAQSALASADSTEERKSELWSHGRKGVEGWVNWNISTSVLSNRTVSRLALSLPKDKHISPRWWRVFFVVVLFFKFGPAVGKLWPMDQIPQACFCKG